MWVHAKTWRKLSIKEVKQVEHCRGTQKGTQSVNTDCAHSVQGEAFLILDGLHRRWLTMREALCGLPHPPLTLRSLPIGALILASTH